MKEFITIKENEEAEIIEKKSRFIANTVKVENKTQVETELRKIHKRYNDARHHCYAYRIMEDTLKEKWSDDGEPSGTAGSPVLSLLQKSDLCNILVVVTRYFGGTLLGTGGLVKAYTEVTKKALEKTEKIKQVQGWKLTLEIEYQQLENWKYYCKNRKINVTNIEYNENCKITIEITEEQKEELNKKIEENRGSVVRATDSTEQYISINLDKETI